MRTKASFGRKGDGNRHLAHKGKSRASRSPTLKEMFQYCHVAAATGPSLRFGSQLSWVSFADDGPPSNTTAASRDDKSCENNIGPVRAIS